MSSSTDAGTLPAHVVRGLAASGATALPTPELRDGSWTRFGAGSVLGDAVTEQALAGLAESTRQAARAQGYATGWAEGRRAAAATAAAEAAENEARLVAEAERREGEHRRHLAALAQAAAGFDEAARSLAEQLEDHALHLARELTELLVGRELRTATAPADDVVRRVLAVLPQGADVTVRVHPDVARAIVGTGTPGSNDTPHSFGDQVSIAADPTLGVHDAVVETPTQVVDLGIASALQRVREALS